MLRKGLVLLIASLCLISTGCQKTPEEPIVEQKKEVQEIEIKEEVIDLIPDHYEDSFSSGNLTVNVNANVIDENTDNLAISRLSATDITQEEMNSIVNTLMRGSELYEPQVEYSKKDILEILSDLKSGANSDLYAADPDAYFEAFAGEISYYEELYKTAPDEVERKKATATITDSNRRGEEGVKSVNVSSNLGKKTEALFQYYNNDTIAQRFYFTNCDGLRPEGAVRSNLDIGLTISFEEAKTLAESTIAEMQFGDFSLSAYGSVPNVGTEDVLNYSSFEEIPKCYIFYYTRNINGMTETYVDPANFIYYPQEEAYNMVWGVETIAVTIDDTGILTVDYSGPKANVLENVSTGIIKFDEVISKFKNQFELQAAINRHAEIIKTDVEITEIVLGGTKVTSKNASGEYSFVPTWDFIGKVTYTYADGSTVDALDENNQFTDQNLRYSFLTINAVDGSVINRAHGY